MKPVRSRAGVILNAAVLSESQVQGRPVLCPGCGEKTLEPWPEGWEAHAMDRCAGLESEDAEDRKEEYRQVFGPLMGE